MPKAKKEKGPSDYGRQGNVLLYTFLFSCMLPLLKN